MIVLVLLMLSAEAGSRAETSTRDPELPTVPAPTSVLITSYNLNPVVCWEYPNISHTPVFSVQVKNYWPGEWTDACTNIFDHCCNIYEQVHDPINSVWARVKARIGQKESDYSVSKDFTMCRQGKIGPPRVDIKRREEQVTVDIFHPEVIVNGEVLGIMFDDDSVCHTFDYRVYVRRNRTGDILFTKHVLKTQDCSETECQLNITVTSLDFEYCVSVEGISDSWELTTEKSKEACISLSHNSIKGSVWIPIVAAFVLLFLIVIVGFAYWHLKKNPLKKQSMILPKSLLSVVRNATSETKPESKYISLITSCQPLVPENETVLSEEPLSPVTTPDNPGEAEHGEHSIETEVVIMEGSTSDLTPDSPPTPIKRENSSPLSSNQSEPCTITLNSYHSRDGSDSGLVGSGSFISDSEFPPPNKPEIKTEEQESTAVRKAPTSFGYDKPHVLVDVIVDGGEKESLIGYRLTARAKELS
ncbi:interferon gamma receptor 1 isoform X1 [Nannospalax galili]|uniref:Interferon gamma receptor 1 n=1 Tax=Nannospalax galili TaxID=1026970 RepID=A0A8C6W4E9_NANGA|nr:interferon gamma receptor 1 isoform X1 [Nannospalax galili]